MLSRPHVSLSGTCLVMITELSRANMHFRDAFGGGLFFNHFRRKLSRAFAPCEASLGEALKNTPFIKGFWALLNWGLQLCLPYPTTRIDVRSHPPAAPAFLLRPGRVLSSLCSCVSRSSATQKSFCFTFQAGWVGKKKRFSEAGFHFLTPR